jgi:hypothetical protein
MIPVPTRTPPREFPFEKRVVIDMQRVWFLLPRLLFLLAALIFAISLFVNWDDRDPGWRLFGTVAWFSVAGLWRAGIADVIPAILATFANLTLIVTVLFGWKLHRRHAMPMLLLSVNGLLSAFLAPAFAAYSFPFPLIGPISPVEMYALVSFVYWLWIASFVLVTLAWAGVVWNQRRMRIATLCDVEVRSPPPQPWSGESDELSASRR